MKNINMKLRNLLTEYRQYHAFATEAFESGIWSIAMGYNRKADGLRDRIAVEISIANGQPMTFSELKLFLEEVTDGKFS